MKLFYIYLAVINIIAFVVMAVDKHRACTYRWRIPERTLFLLALLGGSAGSLLCMFLLWHKVRNRMFLVGLNILLAVQVLLTVTVAVLSR